MCFISLPLEHDQVKKITDDQLTWADARNRCRLNEMNLVTVKDDIENTNINTKKNELTLKDIWLGLYVDGWRWSDHSNNSFKHWLEKEPNNKGGKELCVTAHTGLDKEGKWNDSNCDEELPFMCYEGEVHVVLHKMNSSNNSVLL